MKKEIRETWGITLKCLSQLDRGKRSSSVDEVTQSNAASSEGHFPAVTRYWLLCENMLTQVSLHLMGEYGACWIMVQVRTPECIVKVKRPEEQNATFVAWEAASYLHICTKQSSTVQRSTTQSVASGQLYHPGELSI